MTWKVNPWIVAIVGALLLLAGTGYYTYTLRSENARLQKERDYQRQRAAAAEDSLKRLRSYRDADDALRTLWGRALFPSQRPDTLSEEVGGEVTSRTEANLDPNPADSAGTIAPDETGPDGAYVYQLDDQVGRYALSGRLNVYPPGDHVRYDITINAQPFRVKFYRTEIGGVRQLRLGLPQTITPAGAQGSYDATAAPQTEARWGVHAPLLATRLGLSGNFGVGARVERSLGLPFGVEGAASLGLLMSPAVLRGRRNGRLFSPEVEVYLRF